MLTRRLFCQARSFSGLSTQLKGFQFLARSLVIQPPIIAVRFVRHRVGDDAYSHAKKESSEEDDKTKSEDEEKEDKKRPEEIELTPELRKRLFLLLFTSSLTFGLLTYYLTSQMMSGVVNQQFGEPVDMNEFTEKFLKAGEVKEIVYTPNTKKAWAFLHKGAVIDGKPYGHEHVEVKYDQEDPEGNKFESDIRRIEESLGVKPQDRIHIANFAGINSIKALEVFIGLGILFFLCTQYGRLAARKMAENSAKTSKQKPFSK